MENYQSIIESTILKTKAIQQAQIKIQETQNAMFIPLPAVTVLANNVNTSQSITINADGWFKLIYITGDIEPTAGGINSISIRITDNGSGRPLTDNAFTPANLFLSPGIRTNTLFNPWKFNYWLEPSASLQFDFLNSDIANRICNIALFGLKVRG